MPRVSEATKAEHRQRLLDAAAAEFAAKGLDGARIDDISVAAGLAKGTIYNYFDSKLHVFRAVIEEWTRRSSEAREALPEEAPVGDHLRSIIVADMAVAKEMEEFARTAFREVIGAPVDVVEELLPAWDPVDAELRIVIERAQGRGELRADRTPEELTRMFLTLVNGLMLEHWMPNSQIGLEDIAALAVDYYLDGARP
jgi:TetR/AcrR family fatty acid metabolism transcriptional regulator